MSTDMRTDQRDEALSAASCSRFPVATPFPIPRGVQTCPECGGRLYWQVSTDDGLEDLHVDCENQPEDIEEDDFHKYWQSDWQPVIDNVRDWISSENSN